MKISGISCETAERFRRPIMVAIVAMAFGCASDDYVDPYSNYYASGYYYPADFAYADPYYADDYYGYSTFYSLSFKQANNGGGKTPAASLFDLSRVESVCPDQVEVTSKKVDAPCSVEGQAGAIPAGATIDFNGCVLPGGGRLDGSIDIESSRTLSDENCDAETVVSVSYTSTSTDLSYTAPNGARVVAPSLSRSGSYTRLLMGAPSALSISTSGNLERYAKDGTLVAQAALTGTQGLVLTGSEETAGYRLDGALTLEDEINGQTLDVDGAGLTRTEACCHPTSGTITITGSGRNTDVWRFGPDCGELDLNGDTVSLSECF